MRPSRSSACASAATTSSESKEAARRILKTIFNWRNTVSGAGGQRVRARISEGATGGPGSDRQRSAVADPGDRRDVLGPSRGAPRRDGEGLADLDDRRG